MKENRVVAGEATEATRRANAALLDALDFGNREDFELASRGLVEAVTDFAVFDGERPIWDVRSYGFLSDYAPDTANPSLWRNARLNAHCGLFQVVDGIYQVRGFDLANMTIIEGQSGIIVVDPLTCIEVARPALELYYRHRPRRPVRAVIHTHSHVDHFGGVKGVCDEADVKAGRVKIIAPSGFLQYAISENVLAGTAMGRRATYMYGNLLPRGAKGQLGAGIGMATAIGQITIIAPTDEVGHTGQEMVVDGVRLLFQLTPDTEAPAEMNFYLPDFRALCLAENASATLHNLYTPRGAQVRDARAWSHYLHEAVRLFGNEAEAMFAGHFWPRWGRQKIVEFIESQADAYKFIHDQTLRLANHGYTMTEIAEQLQLPAGLGSCWCNRGYYGTVNHNSKAVYQRYLGWFDGNPSNLHPLPPEQAAPRYVACMGGADAMLEKAQAAYAAGEYRWVAQLLHHLVFAEPQNQSGRDLLADALEQLGYQAESAVWRNFYLTGAQELRHGVPKRPGRGTMSADLVRALPLGEYFDLLGVRLNSDKAEGKRITINFEFPDTGDRYVVWVRNSVLVHVADMQDEAADATVRLDRRILDDVTIGLTTFPERLMAGEIAISGDPRKLAELFGLFDKFEFWFSIIEP